MSARDERTGLMNEILGAIRMIKFMAWERKFEERVEEVRKKELKYLRRNYIIEVRSDVHSDRPRCSPAPLSTR
jgi:hypothetical protein